MVQKTTEFNYVKCIDCGHCKSFKIIGGYVKICSETKKEIKYPFKLILCKLFVKPKRRKESWHTD